MITRLALAAAFLYSARVLAIARFIGITNAAIWLGATVYYLLGVAPIFPSLDRLRVLPWSHGGVAALSALNSFFVLQSWCGLIAVGHLLFERLYASKPLRRWVLFIVVINFAWALIGNFSLHDKLNRLHLETYGARSTPQQREAARKSYRAWSGTMQFMNVLVCLGLVGYLWEVTASTAAPRFVSSGKFRG